MGELFTIWGEQMDKTSPLPEYPRPQLERKSYFNLNGLWKYTVTKENGERIRGGEILVPFSPEAPLSGCDFQLNKDEILQYERYFIFPKEFVKDRIILHFGAVDQLCTVQIDGNEVGSHIGGYLPFSFDITECLQTQVVNHSICVIVRDFVDEGICSYGKQKVKRGGIWYTPQSGIWQTVWMESVCKNYVQSVCFTPNIEPKICKIQVFANNPSGASVFVVDKNQKVAEGVTDSQGVVEIRIPDEHFHLWTPETPFLYHVDIELGEDTIHSYFGMRSFGKMSVRGKVVPTLNGQPYFETGLLDQGYWPDGLYTAPSDEALIYDIKIAKEMGFNMLRKHIKVEPLRWYYYCDCLGMLVWQDMPSGGNPFKPLYTQILPFIGIHLKDNPSKKFGRENPEARKQFEQDFEELQNLLYNCVSLCTWVPFNEGWGQFDSKRIAMDAKKRDPSRLVDHASGWHDQKTGDYKSIHIYYRPLTMKKEKDRILALTEFGGYSLKVDGHIFGEDTFGYKGYHTKDALEHALEKLYRKGVLKNKEKKNLSVVIYTQISDVEDELNGLMTYDRKVVKIDPQKMKVLNDQFRKNK